MDFNFLLGIFGFIATLIFGVLSIYLYIRKRYPVSIVYIEEQAVGLFDSIVKNFPNITILHDNKVINESLVLLKGSIVNDGSADIKESPLARKFFPGAGNLVPTPYPQTQKQALEAAAIFHSRHCESRHNLRI